MSIDASAWAKSQKAGSILGKAVLMRLADMADERWSCFPGVELLAEETEATPRGVRKSLRVLEEQGLITTMIRHRANGSATSSRYFLNGPGAPHMSVYGSLTAPTEQIIETPLANARQTGTPPELSSPPPGTQFPTPRNSVPPTGGNSVPAHNHPDEPPSEPLREPRDDVRAVLDALGEAWTVGRMDALELEPAIVRALDELGWTVDRLAAELAKNPGGVRYPSRVLKRRLDNLRAVARPAATSAAAAKDRPRCPDHPSAAPRPDGECSGCWVDREGWNDASAPENTPSGQ